MAEYKGYEKAVEMLEEMGKYYGANIEDVAKELKELEKLGFNCYYDSNTDYIVWEDYQEEF